MKTSDIPDRAVCIAYAEFSKNRPSAGGLFPYQILMSMFDAPFKVAYAACERAARRDLVDYGVSLRTGWLTDKGLVILEGKDGK